MMNFEPSPFPWEVICHTDENIDHITSGSDWTLVDANGNPICAESPNRAFNIENNIRLLVAAPELYECLVELVDAGEEAWGDERPCVKFAKQLILKINPNYKGIYDEEE